jgi:glutaredoxin
VAEQEPEKKEEEEIIEEEDPALKNPKIEIDGQDMTMGSKLSFTFEQGLIV